MGSGASFDAGLTTDYPGDNYFCHSCHRVIVVNTTDNGRCCPLCQSSFLEELGGGRGNFDVISLRHRANGQLTLEQARRIANATAMLRLLETQLREELENLQRAFEAATNNYDNRRKEMFTKLMKSHLRKTTPTLDVICSQPSCPICSEDFVVEHEVSLLPCSHIFHMDCVMPWLDQKQNCPICRTDVPHSVPSLEELDKRSVEELRDNLKDINAEVSESLSTQREELVSLLHTKLNEMFEKENLASENGDTRRTAPIVNFTVRTFTPLAHVSSLSDNYINPSTFE